MGRAVLDDRLSVRIVSERLLRYTQPAGPDDDRPPHVRAASGIAVLDGKLLVVQDDAAFVAIIDGDEVRSVALPRGPGGRRRFGVALGNKHDKPDLEACFVDRGELVAIGSGSRDNREHVVRVRDQHVSAFDAHELYATLRDAIGALNLEGATCMRDELWLFHRGNTGKHDPGPAIARLSLAAFRAYLDGSAAPPITAIDRYDLGSIDGVRLGFTDATTFDDRVFVICAAEASRDAIADGAVFGSQLGVIEADSVRCATLVGRDVAPIKAEGLTFTTRDTAWITVDPDDPDVPAPLYEVELFGPWR